MNVLFRHYSFIAALVFVLCASSCSKGAPSAATKLTPPSPRLVAVGTDNAGICWSPVSGAASYEVFINNRQTIAVTDTAIVLSGLSYDATYSVRLRAMAPKGSGSEKNSDYGPTLSFTTGHMNALTTPVVFVRNLSPKGFVVYWNPVLNAAKYSYEFNGGQAVETTETSLSFDNLSSSTEYPFRVQALPSGEDSRTYMPSGWAELPVTTLDKIALSSPHAAVISVSDDYFLIEWSSVDGAVNYSVSVNDGEETVIDKDETEYLAENLKVDTEYKVKLRALPEKNSSVYIESQPTVINVVTRGSAGEQGSSTESYVIE